METMTELNIRLSFSKKNTLPLLVLFFLLWHPGFIGSESLTLTTYYPAPYGGYVSILTTGNTILARDAGNVAVGPGAPAEKLHVTGNIRASSNLLADVDVKAANTVTWGARRGVLSGDQGASVELGGVGTPYIDFSRTAAEDYSARIMLSQAGRIMVVGDLEVTGSIINVCSRVGYGVGADTPCPAGKQIVGFMAAGCGTGLCKYGFLPANLSGGNIAIGTYISIGADWAGTMVCCKF